MSPCCFSPLNLAVEAAQLARSFRGLQGCISTTAGGRPSEEVWENGAFRASGTMGLRQSLEIRGGEFSFCLDLEDSVEASAGGVMEEGFT